MRSCATKFHLGRVSGFLLRGASRKRCEIEFRSQFITDRKSYIGFRLEQKSITLNDLERQLAALSPFLLAERCNLHCNVRLLSEDVVCLSSVMRVHYDRMD